MKRNYYFEIFPRSHTEGVFEFNLSEPLHIGNDECTLEIKKCLLPKFQVYFLGGKFIYGGGNFILPEMYISSVSQIVEKIKDLTGNKLMIQFSPKDRKMPVDTCQLALPPGEKIQASSSLADLLFEGKRVLQNQNEETILTRVYKTGKNYDREIYYLTCNLLENIPVGNFILPLLNTVIVNPSSKTPHSTVHWEGRPLHSQTYIKKGVYNRITFQIYDTSGKLVKINSGLLFIHIQICT